MRLNLRQVEAFRAVMEFGTATAASKVLHVTQPAVSRLLGDLELAIGFSLFERRGRSLTPTADAQALYEEVKRSFVGLDRIGQVADTIREKATGQVRVIALSKYADGFVATVAGRFLRDNPGVTVELESAGTAGVVDGIATQGFDIAIASATLSDGVIVAEPLFEAKAALALPADDPLAADAVVKLRALEGRRMVALPDDSEYGAAIAGALRRARVTPVIAGIARTHASLCRMVAEGAGLALVDRTCAASSAAPGIVFRPTDPEIARGVALLRNTRTPLSIAARAFVDALREGVRDGVADA